MFCNHHHYPVPLVFHHSQEKSVTIKQLLLISPFLYALKAWYLYYVHEFACSKYCMLSGVICLFVYAFFQLARQFRLSSMFQQLSEWLYYELTKYHYMIISYLFFYSLTDWHLICFYHLLIWISFQWILVRKYLIPASSLSFK